MITNVQVKVASMFINHQIDMAAELYQDGAEAHMAGEPQSVVSECWEDYQAAEVVSNLMIDYKHELEHELDMQAFVEECRAAYKAELDYGVMEAFEHSSSEEEFGAWLKDNLVLAF